MTEPQPVLAFIFANGDLAVGVVLPERKPEDLVIAADGGIRHAFALNIRPQVVVGDFDSAPSELVQIAQARGAEIIRHPVGKDKTDLELAVDIALERGAADILIIGALGGRLDHELANILLPASRRYRETRIRIIGHAGTGAAEFGLGDIERWIAVPGREPVEIAVVTATIDFRGRPGDIVSILPLADSAGITTSGLQYPLAGDALELGTSRGLSNVMTGQSARIEIESGILLVVHISLHDNGAPDN